MLQFILSEFFNEKLSKNAKKLKMDIICTYELFIRTFFFNWHMNLLQELFHMKFSSHLWQHFDAKQKIIFRVVSIKTTTNNNNKIRLLKCKYCKACHRGSAYLTRQLKRVYFRQSGWRPQRRVVGGPREHQSVTYKCY